MTTTNDENDEIEQQRIDCLVRQGFTPTLAKKVLLARSREYLPLTIWIVDNSGSMGASDGRKLVSTESQDDVRLLPCTRWEELKETVLYHAQLAALLDAPTKFLMLNGSGGEGSNSTYNHYGDDDDDFGGAGSYPQEMTIAERGSEWIEDDMEQFVENFSRVSPRGCTPLTSHLRRIYRSLPPSNEKIVLVLATDGRPTDDYGYTSYTVDREFENALKQVASRAWIVIRLCTNDDSILEYYNRLDDEMELSLEVLDDFIDEAKEVHGYNPWLTYSLPLHRCREMGMSCHSSFRFLDWLDERTLSRDEISRVLKGTFGLIETSSSSRTGGSGNTTSSSIYGSMASVELDEDWDGFCAEVERHQRDRRKHDGPESKAFFPWNPMQKRTTHWVDIKNLKKHGYKSFFPLFEFRWPDLRNLFFCTVVFVVYLKAMG